MESFISKIRVGYADTDQMGIVPHSNYLKYYETARWSFFRKLGVPYKTLEEKGFLLPVVDVAIHFIKPAYYDEVLTAETTILALNGPKLVLSYKLYNEEQELINTAKITLAFMSIHTRKACKPPLFMEQLWQNRLSLV